MNITFISPYLSLDCFGIRILAALLRNDGHQANIIFLPDKGDQSRRHYMKSIFSYSPATVKQVVDACKGSDLIGITLMTQYFDVAVQLTRAIKTGLNIPVIWGGIHPTVTPEESLRYADMVCVGEGEFTVKELVKRLETGSGINDIPGLWIKDKSGGIVRNGIGRIASDISSLLFPEYNFGEDRILQDCRIAPLTKEILYEHLKTYFPALSNPDVVQYQLITSRGCPYKCSFCGEVPLAEYYGTAHYFRRRNLDNIFDEIFYARDNVGGFGEICFCDDSFLSRPLSEIKHFSARYKNEVGLPFYCLVAPSDVTEDKMDFLVDAGLRNIGMGIQSGSERLLKEYGRDKFGGRKQIEEAVRIIDKYHDKLIPYYDFIHENPYETNEDLRCSLKMIIDLPKTARIRLYSMVLYPQTEMHKKAKEDGYIKDELGDCYRKVFGSRYKKNYLNSILDLANKRFPKPLLKFMMAPNVSLVLDNRMVNSALLAFYLLAKRLKRLLVPKCKGL